jgi:hypothetical protein
MNWVYRYIGNGEFLLGVPRRNLNSEDVETLFQQGWTEEKLLATGLYAKFETVTKPKQQKVVFPQNLKEE